MAAEAPTQRTDDAAGVVQYRYRQARHAGLTPADAIRFAESDADIGLLRKLARLGCPPDLIARIVM